MKRIKNDIRDNFEFNSSLYDNEATYIDFLRRMTKICLSIFEWENLPESMDSRFLEESLFFYGQAALLHDETVGYVNTLCAGENLNMYRLPSTLNCYSPSQVFQTYRAVYSGLIKEVKEEDKDKYCVLVKNSWDRIPTAYTIQLFAERLYQAQRVIDTNINAQKTPIIMLGTEKQKLTLENLYKNYDGNTPVIYGDKDLITNEAFKAIKTDSPYVADKVQNYKKEIWNEFLTFIGVNNIDVEKHERLISGESEANNEVINLNLQSYLEPRKKACEEFNKLYGTNISVKLRSDLNNLIKLNESVVDDYASNDLLDDGVPNGSGGVKNG